MDTRKPLLRTLIALYVILSNAGVNSINLNYRSDNKNCVCFENPSSDTLDKVLDPDDKGLNRLVIYVYKDSEDQIKTYVPNIKKQLKFPDFAFEDGDITNTDPYESISTVFDTSPNVVTVNPKMIYLPAAQTPGGHKPGHNNIVKDVSNNALLNQNLPQGTHTSSNVNPTHETDGESENQAKSQNNNKPNQIPSHDPMSVDNENLHFPGKPLGLLPISFLKQSFKNKNHTHPKTFDQWFGKEIKNVAESMKSNPDQLSTLEDLIQSILSTHGIKITSKGILTDSKGSVLDMSELHLTPVLIGDTLEYEKVKKKSKKTFSLPSDLPYLEVLLITLQHPPKVLGIIPLRKVYIPSKDFKLKPKDSPTNEYELSSQTNKSTKFDLSGEKTLKKVQKNNNKGRRLQEDTLNKEYEIAKILKQYYSYYKSEAPVDLINQLIKQITTGQNNNADGDNKAKHKITESFPKTLKLYSQHAKRDRKTVKKHLKAKPEAFLETEINDFNGIARSNPRSDGGSRPVLLNSQSLLGSLVGRVVDRIMSRRQELGGIVEDLAGPDFRIIGGAAATGSGSPISNRGRSGFIL